MAPTTRRNSALLHKIRTLQLTLAPLVPLPCGPPHPDFPKTLMAFHLLTEDQLDSIASYYHQSTPGPWTDHYPARMNWCKDFLARPERAARAGDDASEAAANAAGNAAAAAAAVAVPRRHSRRLSQTEREFVAEIMTTVEALQKKGGGTLASQPEGEGLAAAAAAARRGNLYAGLSDKERIRIKRRKVGKFIGLVGMETPAEEIAGRIQASLERAVERSREELRRSEEVGLRRRKAV